MTSKNQRAFPRRLLIVVTLLGVLIGSAPAAADVLADLRGARRDQIRAASLRPDKSGQGAPFGLLVIPVDFSDARFGSSWEAGRDLAPRLTGDTGETLRNYFDVASGGRCDLRVTLAPTIHLTGPREDYLAGFASERHTRPLAEIALADVAATGLALRLLDMDGPDGLPGSADDDGIVDGVLILHAGPGLEDGGIIPPQQFYLEEPLVADGVKASLYAVASAHAGLGIWAHETLHLLGLEERYDPLQPSSPDESEIHSRGGLGRFSVMAAGAWGTGAGRGCALPDAYGCWQLGWYDTLDLPAGAPRDTLGPAVVDRRVARVWTHGEPGHEFFLLEVRDPSAAAPFDAAVPGGSLLIHHVDETVPDGWRTVMGSDYRLRVHLVEADADGLLREGEDEGHGGDLFPGDLGVTAFTPTTTPSSAGWTGPSYVSLTEIETVAGGVAFSVKADHGPAISHDFAVRIDDTPAVELAVHDLGLPLIAPSATLTAAATAYGSFFGGAASIDIDLVEEEPGRWVASAAIPWYPAQVVPDGATTHFTLRVTDGAWSSDPLPTLWPWSTVGDALDFSSVWPGGWNSVSVDNPDRALWHRWTGAGVPTRDGRAVLVCTGSEHGTAASWPDVAYGRSAHATLTTPPLGTDVTALRVVHAWDMEILPTGVGMDGGTAFWVAPDSSEIPALPRDGWTNRIERQSSAALHDLGGVAGPMELDDNDVPIWRADVFAVPDHRPGPWRLRFAFASNSADYDGPRRGWIIADVTALTSVVPTSAWPVAWTGDELVWGVGPAAIGATADIEVVVDHVGDTLGAGPITPDVGPDGFFVPAHRILPYLPGDPRTRHLVRITEDAPWGRLASRAVVVQPDGGDAVTPFGNSPWPNPARGDVRFLLDVPTGAEADVRIYDVRGHLVRESHHGGGQHLLRWDGRDRQGRPAPAGTYFMRVSGATVERTHKVVLLR